MAQDPTPAPVAQAATEEGMLPSRTLVLLGTMTGPDPRALVRLPSGRIETVKPGARLQGYDVAGIQDGLVLLVRNGQSRRLSMP